MRSIFYKATYIFPLLLLLAAGSCKKLIEIPASPANAIGESDLFADSASAMSAVAGVYAYASYGHGFMFNDGNFPILTSLSADELSAAGSGAGDVQFYTNSLTDLNESVGTLWANPYTGLYQVNAVISNVAASKGLSASFKTQIPAEMKVMRALYYFYTVNLFGPVPMVLSTDYKVTSRLPRMSVDSVYGQILTDLNDAIGALPAAYPSEGHKRPNLYVAKSLLAKAQLYRQQWQAAYDAADAVIGSGEYDLETDLNNVFLDGSQEAIWQLEAAGSNNVTQEAAQLIPYDVNTAPTYLVTSTLLNAFESGDQRRQDWVTDYVINVNGADKDYYGVYKYKQTKPGAAVPEDYMVFRLAEQYLIRAEAAAHLGKITEAVADVDAVRARAGLGRCGAVTAEDVQAAVMHERQVELFNEWGNRWLDLKRTGTIDAVLGAEKPGWQPYKALYPVPRKQRQFNDRLTQNTGY